MNLLSLLSGPLPLNPKQNIKQAAFLQYLKSFAQNGLQTLQKLQNQFNKHYIRSTLPQDLKIFQKIKTLISSYEVFILCIGFFQYEIEMNDSCEFIQVPEFGTCLLKVFIQLIGILNWAMQQLLVRNYLFEMIEKKAQFSSVPQRNEAFSPKYSQTMKSSFSSSMNSSSKPKSDQKFMRNTFHGNMSYYPTNSIQNRCAQCSSKSTNNPSFSPYQIYKTKQQTTMQLKDINEEIVRISKQYTQEEKKIQKQDYERDKLQKFIEKREQDGRNFHFLNVGLGDRSRNEQLLTEILFTLNRKSDAIKRFADLRMTSIGESNRIQTVCEQDYQNLKEEVSSNLQHKILSAKQKLYLLFKQQIIQHQRIKQQQMVQKGVQVEQNESIKMNKFDHDRTIKRLTNEVEALQTELEFERKINQQMKKLLQDKSIEYQSQTLKYRNQLISVEFRSRRQLKKLQQKYKHQQQQSSILLSVDNNNNNKSRQQLPFSINKRNSQISIYINQNDQQINLRNIYQQTDQDENDGELDEGKRIVSKNFLKTGKRISKFNKNLNLPKFKKLNEKLNRLEIKSSVVHQFIIAPTIPNKQIQKVSSHLWLQLPKQAKKTARQTHQHQIEPNEITQQQLNKKSTTKDCSVQTIIIATNDLSQKFSYLIDNSCLRIKRSSKQINMQKIVQSPSQMKKRQNRMTYTTKKSSNHFEDFKNRSSYRRTYNNNNNNKKQDISLLDCCKLYSKSSNFLQRGVKINTVQHNTVKNQFTPLNLVEDGGKKDFYRKKPMQSVENSSIMRNQTIEKEKQNKQNRGVHFSTKVINFE